MDERLLRIYQFLYRLGRKELEDIPEEYRDSMAQQDH